MKKFLHLSPEAYSVLQVAVIKYEASHGVDMAPILALQEVSIFANSIRGVTEIEIVVDPDRTVPELLS